MHQRTIGTPFFPSAYPACFQAATDVSDSPFIHGDGKQRRGERSATLGLKVVYARHHGRCATGAAPGTRFFRCYLLSAGSLINGAGRFGARPARASFSVAATAARQEEESGAQKRWPPSMYRFSLSGALPPPAPGPVISLFMWRPESGRRVNAPAFIRVRRDERPVFHSRAILL